MLTVLKSSQVILSSILQIECLWLHASAFTDDLFDSKVKETTFHKITEL